MSTINEKLNNINNTEEVRNHSYFGIDENVRGQIKDAGFQIAEGKVREIAHDRKTTFLYHTDKLTAFDRYIDMVPYKGVILTAINGFWLQKVSQKVPNHFLGMPHPRVIKAMYAEPIKAEIIVRGYLAGSMLRAYQKGERVFCGITLPDHLRPYQQLPAPIITPTSKAEAFAHDENMTAEELIEGGICRQDEFAAISEMAMNLFSLGQEIYGEKGWILVDTKYEFGRLANGDVILIDEVHTPDSSRLWVKESYQERLTRGEAPEMLDKENVRRYLIDKGFSGEGDVPHVPAEVLVSLAKVYLNVAQTLIGEELAVDAQTNMSWMPSFR